MRVNNDWFFIKYDIRGRSIITGLYRESNTSRQTRQGMQDHLESETNYWENRSALSFSAQHGYTNDQAFPQGYNGVEIWTVTWYDDYDFNYDGTPDENFVKHADFDPPSGNNLAEYEVDLNRTDGMVTGTLTKVLNDRQVYINDFGEYDSSDVSTADEVYYIGSTNNNYQIRLLPGFNTNPGQKVHIGSSDIAVPTEIMDGEYLQGVTFYDKYGNSIYTKSTNHVGGTDESWILYTFDGLISKTIAKHQSASENITIRERFEYNTNGTLSSQYHQIDNGTEEKITALSYNELGQIWKKYLHNDPSQVQGTVPYSQTLDYLYNERGWLKSINNPDNLVDPTYGNNDLFAYRLSYNSTAASGSNAGLYSGNITNMEWRDSGGRHCFDYFYDGLNQLSNANYVENCDSQDEFSSLTPNAHGTNYQYDLNGNLEFLSRRNQGSFIDSLNYTYNGIGNRITSIDDAISGTEGFRDDYLSVTTEYIYDLNGNMVSDANKGINFITYNLMNLPEIIEFEDGNKIIYLYDATGTKLAQTTYPTGGGTGVNTEYSSGFIYEDDALSYFSFSEGTIREVSGNFRYEYNLTDHLGNVRATFYPYILNSANLLQRDSYYPFGLRIPGLSYLASGTEENKFTYNGKEIEDEFGLSWYDYGARLYDHLTGRWWNIDPLGQFHSPYLVGANNLIAFKDSDGEWVHIVAGGLIGAAVGVYNVAKDKGLNPKNWDMKDVGRIMVSTATGATIAAIPATAGVFVGGTSAGGISALGNIADQSIRNIGTENEFNYLETAVSGLSGGLSYAIAQPATSWLSNKVYNIRNTPTYDNGWLRSYKYPTWYKLARSEKLPGFTTSIGNSTGDLLGNIFNITNQNTWLRWFSSEKIPHGSVTVEEGTCYCITEN